MEQSLRAFVKVAELCWRELASLEQNKVEREELFNNWLQVNWELVVERSLRKEHPDLWLDPYGDGADRPGGKVLNPAARTTHRVYCRPKKGDKGVELISGNPIEFPQSGLPLEAFVSCNPGEWHRFEPPLDSVLIDQLFELESGPDHPLVFRREEMTFYPLPIDSPGR